MNNWYGNFVDNETVYMTFNTFDSDGASITATIVDGDIEVYKDGGTTELATNGATVQKDFDGVTGAHQITIDTSASGDYAIGSDYSVRVTTITVDSQTISAFVGTLSIENRCKKSDLISILGTALTETAGLLSAGFKKFFNVGTPTGTLNSLADAVPGAAGGGFIAGTNAATSITTALTANITGNLSGSVGTVAANGITATSLATDAINAASVKADAVTKIQNGLSTLVATDIVTAGAIVTDTGAVSEVGTVLGNVNGTTSLADDAITAAKFDESTAFPIKSADTGSTQIARTGADGDTLETISDEIEVVDGVVDRIAAIQESDKVFVPAAGTLTYNTKGTSSGILKKNLKDPAGAAVNSTEDIIAAEVDTTP